MLEAGDAVPDVTLYERAQPVPLASFRGRPVVLFFYPKDDTAGCTAEACSFRDGYDAFVRAGAEVVGVSSDDGDSHDAFARKYRLPFRLLSDPGGAARKAFGIKKTLGLLPGRATFVIGRDGTILHAFDSQFEPLRHVREALQALEAATS
jgi:thioredoxin-dependent peroxiredoxin